MLTKRLVHTCMGKLVGCSCRKIMHCTTQPCDTCSQAGLMGDAAAF